MRSAISARLAIPGDAGYSAPVLPPTAGDEELGLVERVVFVRRLLTYGSARVEALADLARDMAVVRAPAGTTLWEVGDPSPHSLLLHRGTVTGITVKGQQFRFGPDSVVGGIDAMASEPRWYRAVAGTDVVGLRSDVARLVDVLEDHPDMGLAMLRTAARVLSGLHDRVAHAVLEESRG